MHEPTERTHIAWLALALGAGVLVVLWPFAPWVLFAVWASTLVRPGHSWLSARLGQRPGLAALITTLALVLLVVPAIVLLVSLAADAFVLVRRVIESDRVQNVVHEITARDPDDSSSSDLVDLVASQGGRAWAIAHQVAGTAARVVIGLVIAIGGLYGLLVDGGRWYAWLETHAPISQPSFRRLAGAFVETGRGLLFGILGAGLAQAAIATVLYVVLDVPKPFALGLLTLACSVIPAVGTSIVWLPVAIALAVVGRTGAAVGMFAAGFLVIGTIDNFVRPYLARKGRLELPTFVVALAMFGGIAAMGPRGVVLGPLLFRLAKEALAIQHDSRSAA
jgi:predicted PurR-regulated permease PerM